MQNIWQQLIDTTKCSACLQIVPTAIANTVIESKWKNGFHVWKFRQREISMSKKWISCFEMGTFFDTRPFDWNNNHLQKNDFHVWKSGYQFILNNGFHFVTNGIHFEKHGIHFGLNGIYFEKKVNPFLKKWNSIKERYGFRLSKNECYLMPN